jgi:hypothetical protein
MHRVTRRMSAVRVVLASAIVGVACLVGQVSHAAADTFNFDVQFAYRYDWPSGSGPISPINFAWSFDFAPVVFQTQLQDDQPTYLRTYTHFAGSGITTAPTPLTADIWASIPADATFTHTTTAYGSQAFMALCNCGFREFSMMDQWMSNDVDADPNVETTIQYLRSFSAGTQNVTGFGDVATFDGLSIVDFLAMSGSPDYTLQMLELFRIQTVNLLTGETTLSGSWWNGIATFDSHIPGSSNSPGTPVPEPASMVLVATGLVATIIRKRARLC